MDQSKAHQEEEQESTNMNIKEFIATARQYLFELAQPQPALATIPVRQER